MLQSSTDVSSLILGLDGQVAHSLIQAQLLLNQFQEDPSPETVQYLNRAARIVNQVTAIMSASPSGSPPAGDRSRLTDQQKKQNHIVSEQKRRQAIRAGFDKIASLIDGYEGQGRSEAVVLEAAVRVIEIENRRKKLLWKIVKRKATTTQAEFQSHYVSKNTAAPESSTDTTHAN